MDHIHIILPLPQLQDNAQQMLFHHVGNTVDYQELPKQQLP